MERNYNSIIKNGRKWFVTLILGFNMGLLSPLASVSLGPSPGQVTSGMNE